MRGSLLSSLYRFTGLNANPLAYYTMLPSGPSDLRGSLDKYLSPPNRVSSKTLLGGDNGEGATRRTRQVVRPRHDPWLQEVARSKSNQYETTSLVQIEGVNTKEEVSWYCGKRMAYIYKAKTKTKGSHYRCIWGKVARPHGNSGVVRAKFKSNLPPESMGGKVRVFMYPSNI
ncbi:large ribosomal subunit protein eL33w isoform X1 [Typha angustifolia]|uniref:large ribosomal subunit protein eL33w isoform X1 n=1 Tax=Typha angustifolia TaxID=59011 RepID=UPI003C2E7E53